MSDNPFFQFYPSDWLAGTRGLTASETGIYITLVAMMYETEAPVPSDTKRLSRLCGCTPSAFKKAVEGLLSTGKLTQDERGFFNRRVEIEIEKRSEKRAAAKQSANRRWEKTKENQATANANASVPQCERNANQKPEPDTKEEPKGSSKKRGSRLTADWVLPRAWGEWAMTEGLSEVCTRREADKFRDYWSARTGAGAAKLDWLATWRLWVRKAIDDRANAQARRGESPTAPKQGEIREIKGQQKIYDNYLGWIAYHA
jgi:uncharacterized protein YdaU (DUF1376 family)